MNSTRSFLALCALYFSSQHAFALLISDLDLNNFDFDVTSYSTGTNGLGLGGDATASGTSGGIGWTISPTNLWTGETTTDGTFDRHALPNDTDNLHPSIDFTLTFDRTVNTLLVALSNGGGQSDSLNFGLTPSDFQGLSFSGSQATLNPAGGAGLALFENINSLTINHTDNNGQSDGFDMAFWVVSATSSSSPIPEPTSIALLGLGLAGFRYSRRKVR